MNAICILCNDIERFKFVTNNLPEEMPDLFIINDTRLGDKTEEFKSIYSNATVIKGADIIEDFPKHENISRFALVLKLLIPWYMFKHYDYDKILLLDDDVFITDKINNLFDEYENGAYIVSPMLTSKYSTTSLGYRLVKKANDIFGVETKANMPRVNGGVLLFSRTVCGKTYEKIVIKFIASDEVTEALSKAKNWRSYYIDERFFSAMYVAYNFSNCTKLTKVLINSYKKQNVESFKRMLSTKAIIHIAFCIDKNKFFEDLIEKGIIK